LNGCTYLVDNHNTQSESTEYVTDLLKRYATYDFGAGGIPGKYPMLFLPTAFSLQATVKSAFKFSRGGIMYKILYSRTPVPVAGPPVTQTTSGSLSVCFGDQPGFVARGNATVLSYSQEDCLDFSVPYGWVLPFTSTGGYDPLGGDPLFIESWENDPRWYAAINQTNPSTPAYYTAVRDDYLIGMLQPPTPLVFPGGKRHKWPKMNPGFLKALRKPVPKADFKDFVHLESKTKSPPAPNGGIFSGLKIRGK